MRNRFVWITIPILCLIVGGCRSEKDAELETLRETMNVLVAQARANDGEVLRRLQKFEAREKNAEIETLRDTISQTATRARANDSEVLKREQELETRERELTAAINADLLSRLSALEARQKKLQPAPDLAPLLDALSERLAEMEQRAAPQDEEAADVVGWQRLPDKTMPVTLKVTEMRFESALRWILRLVGLDYRLRDGSIYVSTPAEIKYRLDPPEVRVYDIADVTKTDSAEELVGVLVKMKVTERAAITCYGNKLVVVARPSEHESIVEFLTGLGGKVADQVAKEPEPPWMKSIRTAIDKRVSFDFVDTPLDDVLAYLGSITGVSIVLDPRVFYVPPGAKP